MDAVFFVVLISIAVGVIAQTQTIENDLPGTADSCDAVLATQVRLGDLGYPDEDRIMKLTDVWALSLIAGDWKVTELVKDCFDAMFPWEGSYGFTVEYMDMTETVGNASPEWEDSVHREYAVEFGGMLKITVFRYL